MASKAMADLNRANATYASSADAVNNYMSMRAMNALEDSKRGLVSAAQDQISQSTGLDYQQQNDIQDAVNTGAQLSDRLFAKKTPGSQGRTALQQPEPSISEPNAFTGTGATQTSSRGTIPGAGPDQPTDGANNEAEDAEDESKSSSSGPAIDEADDEGGGGGSSGLKGVMEDLEGGEGGGTSAGGLATDAAEMGGGEMIGTAMLAFGLADSLYSLFSSSGSSGDVEPQEPTTYGQFGTDAPPKPPKAANISKSTVAPSFNAVIDATASNSAF
mgnify:CR=1 FL=1